MSFDKKPEFKDPKPEILAFIEKHKGEIVLEDVGGVVRLDGFYEDEMDYYYKVFKLGSGTVMYSCVGGLIPLKGYIPDKEYDRVERIFNLNADVHQEVIENLEKDYRELVAPGIKWWGLVDKETKNVVMVLKDRDVLCVEDFAQHDVPLPKEDEEYEVIQIGLYRT